MSWVVNDPNSSISAIEREEKRTPENEKFCAPTTTNLKPRHPNDLNKEHF
jgi:hypothetical protein